MNRFQETDAPIDALPVPVAFEQRGIQVVVVSRPVRDVVSWHGSIETHPRFAAGEELTQDVVTSLLNKGTRKRDRFELALELEDRGAEISFGSSGSRVHFSGRSLARDVPHILKLTAEQLIEPLLDPSEFEKVIQRERASLRRFSQSTSYRAGVALRGRLFTAAHPNFSLEPAAELDLLARISPEDVRSYHESHFGHSAFAVCMAGDFDPGNFADSVVDAFGDWIGGAGEGEFDVAGRLDDNRERMEIYIDDRDNLDVRVGHAVHLRRNNPDYLALYVANYILGGNFSARLMTKVRNEMGLTYGIGSSLTGFDAAYEGMWQISVTLSKDRLEEGVAATLEEVRSFLETGVTAEELAAKKTTICGSYEVGLSTTRGLAHTLHGNLRNGFPPDYLRDFPGEIRSLSLDEVNAAVRRYLDFDQLRVVIAGSLPEVQ